MAKKRKMVKRQPIKSITFPIINLDGKDFVLLNHYVDSWDFRALDISKPRQRKEPSGHRLREVKGTGMVKCCPKKINFEDVLPD